MHLIVLRIAQVPDDNNDEVSPPEFPNFSREPRTTGCGIPNTEDGVPPIRNVSPPPLCVLPSMALSRKGEEFSQLRIKEREDEFEVRSKYLFAELWGPPTTMAPRRSQRHFDHLRRPSVGGPARPISGF